MKIIVTGGAGFIGSNIADRMLKLGHEVAIIDSLKTGKPSNLNKEARFYDIDILNEEMIQKAFFEFKPEICIHHAAQTDVNNSIRNPKFDCDVNIAGSINILNSCVKNNVKKIIYASSAAVYGTPQFLPIDEGHPKNPISFYGISKLTPEYYIKIYSELYGLKFTVLRYSNVYGIRQNYKAEGGVVAIFFYRLINKKKPVIFGDGSQTRDFIYVKDVVNANVAALTKGNSSIVNISSNTAISINELLIKISKILGEHFIAEYREEKKGDIRHNCLNNLMAKKVLEWEVKYSLDMGLHETYEYYMDMKITP